MLRQIVIVPVAELNRASQRALAFAQGLGNQVYAVHVTEEVQEAKGFSKELYEWDPKVKLIVLESPYRAVIEPMLS